MLRIAIELLLIFTVMLSAHSARAMDEKKRAEERLLFCEGVVDPASVFRVYRKRLGASDIAGAYEALWKLFETYRFEVIPQELMDELAHFRATYGFKFGDARALTQSVTKVEFPENGLPWFHLYEEAEKDGEVRYRHFLRSSADPTQIKPIEVPEGFDVRQTTPPVNLLQVVGHRQTHSFVSLEDGERLRLSPRHPLLQPQTTPRHAIPVLDGRALVAGYNRWQGDYAGSTGGVLDSEGKSVPIPDDFPSVFIRAHNLSPDRQVLALMTDQNEIHTFNVRDLSRRARISDSLIHHSSDRFKDTYFSSRGTWLATKLISTPRNPPPYGVASVLILDPEGRELPFLPRTEGVIHGPIFSPDETKMAWVIAPQGEGNPTLEVWDMFLGRRILERNFPNQQRSFSFSADSQHLVREVRLNDGARGLESYSLAQLGKVYSHRDGDVVAHSPDGTFLVVSTKEDNRLDLLDYHFRLLGSITVPASSSAPLASVEVGIPGSPHRILVHRAGGARELMAFEWKSKP